MGADHPPDAPTESAGAEATRVDAPGALKPGSVVGRYVVLSEVGQGGMGAVFAAYDAKLDRKVALKLLHPEGSASFSSAEATVRMQREAQALARVSHPNTVAVYEIAAHEGRIFIAMEFVDGQTLRQWLDGPARRWDEALPMLVQAGEGLAAIHDAGLVHRDFKTNNVVVARDGRVKVLDFGLARLSEDSRPSEAPPSQDGATPRSSLDTPLTVDGRVAGTAGYVSPEQFQGEPATAASDQFAFGVALYSALYGNKPWSSANFMVYLAELKRGPPSSPPAGSRAPRWLFPIVRRALATNPQDRFPSMRALLDALGKDPARTRQKVRVGLAVGALALVAAWASVRAARGDCPTQTQLLNGLWPLAARAELARAFTAVRPEAGPHIELALAMLDRRMNDWAAQSASACRAAAGSSARPADVVRMVCLKRRGEQVQLLIDVMRSADPQVAAKLDELVDFFTEDMSCADARALNRLHPDDVAPAQLSEARELRKGLLRVRALTLLERASEALVLARQMAGQAQDAGLKGFEGEALYRCGYLEAYLGEDDTATRDYRASLFASMVGGVDDRALWAGVKLTRRQAKREGELALAQQTLDLCETLLGRLGNDPKVELDVVDAREALLQANGKLDEMLGLNQRRLALSKSVYAPESREVVQAMVDLSLAQYRAGQVTESVEMEQAAAAVMEKTLGPDEPMLTSRYLSLGDSLGELGRRDEGVAMLEKGLALGRRVLDPNDTTLADLESGLAWLLEGKDEPRAYELADHAVKRYERGPPSADLASALLARARPLAALGRGTPALADCDRARTMNAGLADPQRGIERGDLMCRARAFEALGKPREAAEAWGAAWALVPASRLPSTRGTVAFGYARTLLASGGPAGQVRALAEEAKADFAIFPGLAWKKAEVEVFLAAEPAGLAAKKAGAGGKHR